MDHTMIVRVLAAGLAVSIGITVAVTAGLLSWLDGANPANAVMRGAAAFAGTVGLVILLMTSLHLL
jgi:hypothetical protein